jgi:hypothetical protein
MDPKPEILPVAPGMVTLVACEQITRGSIIIKPGQRFDVAFSEVSALVKQGSAKRADAPEPPAGPKAKL